MYIPIYLLYEEHISGALDQDIHVYNGSDLEATNTNASDRKKEATCYCTLTHR